MVFVNIDRLGAFGRIVLPQLEHLLDDLLVGGVGGQGQVQFLFGAAMIELVLALIGPGQIHVADQDGQLGALIGIGNQLIGILEQVFGLLEFAFLDQIGRLGAQFINLAQGIGAGRALLLIQPGLGFVEQLSGALIGRLQVQRLLKSLDRPGQVSLGGICGANIEITLGFAFLLDAADANPWDPDFTRVGDQRDGFGIFGALFDEALDDLAIFIGHDIGANRTRRENQQRQGGQNGTAVRDHGPFHGNLPRFQHFRFSSAIASA